MMCTKVRGRRQKVMKIHTGSSTKPANCVGLNANKFLLTNNHLSAGFSAFTPHHVPLFYLPLYYRGPYNYEDFACKIGVFYSCAVQLTPNVFKLHRNEEERVGSNL